MADKQEIGTTRPFTREMKEVKLGLVDNDERRDEPISISTSTPDDGLELGSSSRPGKKQGDEQKMNMKTLFRSSLSNLTPRLTSTTTTTTSHNNNNNNNKKKNPTKQTHGRSGSDELAQIPNLARSQTGPRTRQRTSLGEEGADTPGTEDGLFGERGFGQQELQGGGEGEAGGGGRVGDDEAEGKRVLRKIDRVSFFS